MVQEKSDFSVAPSVESDRMSVEEKDKRLHEFVAGLTPEERERMRKMLEVILAEDPCQ